MSRLSLLNVYSADQKEDEMFQLSDNDRPFRGRRITWEEFTEQTGRPRPVYVAANDNELENEKAA